jgi:hypothetical protein
MSAWPRTYRYLAGLEDSAVDEALAAGTRQLDGAYLRFAVEVLLQRGQPAGLSAIVDCYHRLGSDLQQALLGKVAEIAPVLRTEIRSHDLQTRLNCLEIASRIGSESLAYLFDFGLMDAQPRVREMSSSMTRRMAARLLADHPLLRPGVIARASMTMPGAEGSALDGPPPRNESDPSARLAQRRQQLFEALLSGTQRYESHLRGEVVEACMWFEPYLGDRFWALLEQSRSRLPRVLSDLLLSSDEPAAAYFLPQATAHPLLRPSAVRTISERRDFKWLQALLRGVALWHPWPRVRRSWIYIKDIACLATLAEENWAVLGQGPALPILIAASNIGVERKGALLGRFLEGPVAPECRRQVLLEACRAKEWGVPLLQSVLNQSQDADEVRMAAYGLLAAGSESLTGDLARRLGTPGDTAVAGLMGLAADLIFWRVWNHFDVMHEEHRVAVLAGIKGFANYLKDSLRAQLVSASTTNRVRAVRMVGLLGLVDVLAWDMLLAAQDPATRVRSAAVRFLGRSSRTELQEQLRLALADKDGRVQANAIDAIDEAGWPDRLRLIVPKLHSDHNRVRGCAAKALARAGQDEAAKAIMEMLEDPRAEYRVTALWTIKQIGADAWSDRLADVAENDPSTAVRRYAQSLKVDVPPAPQPTAKEK